MFGRISVLDLLLPAAFFGLALIQSPPAVIAFASVTFLLIF